MKKVINITVGGTVFLIEEAAYAQLDQYLSAIRRHFAKDKAGEEILDDIECSVADKFSKKKNTSISEEDVAQLIAQMGTLKDFTGSETEEEFTPRKRLYRDPEDKIIAGVASGLAAYFAIDTVIVRLIFLVSIFFGGLGIFAYIILWIAMPEAKTRVQQLEMRGEGITLKEIEKSVKSQVEKLKKKDWSATSKGVTDRFSAFFHACGQIFWHLINALRILAAIILMVVGIGGVLFSSFVFSWAISGSALPFADLNFSAFVGIGGGIFFLFTIALYCVILVPLVTLFLLGLSLLRKHLIGGATLIIILAVSWFIALGFTSSLVVEKIPHIESTIEYLDEHGR